VPLLAGREHHPLVHDAVHERALHALAPVRVDAGIDGVGEDVVHRPIGGRDPAHLPVSRSPARQLALLGH
jgi:hypothetical protein